MREHGYSGFTDEVDQYEGGIIVNNTTGEVTSEPKADMTSILSSPSSPSSLSSSSTSLSSSFSPPPHHHSNVGDDILEEPLELVDLRMHAEIAASRKTVFQQIMEDKSMLKSIHLGFGFCLLFLGFDACQDLVTTFHEKDGSAGLAILYFVFGFSSFFAPMIVDLVGIRLSLFCASIGYVMFIVCVEPYLDTIFYPISVVEGFAAALLWTAQPVYISKCATDPSVLGKYSGVFYAIFQTAIILVHLSAALLSTNIKEESLLYILASIAFTGSITIALIRKPETEPSETRGNSNSKSKPLEFDSLGKVHASPPTSPDLSLSSSSILATSVDDILVHPVEKPKPFSLLIQTLKLSVSSKMLWLHAVFIHQGLSNAIFMGAFPLQMKESMIGFVIATFGISNVIGSIFWGKVYDAKGWKILTITAVFLGPASYFVSCLNSHLFPLFIAAVGFGFLDSLQNILVFGIISTNYPNEQEKVCAFAVSKFSNALASGLSFFSIPYLSYSIIAFMASVNILLVCVCIFCLFYSIQNASSFSSLLALHNKFDFSFLDPSKLRKHSKMHDENVE